ncbi:MAG: hypothetical protein V6Z81_08920 [Parvularculales bacterium]
MKSLTTFAFALMVAFAFSGPSHAADLPCLFQTCYDDEGRERYWEWSLIPEQGLDLITPAHAGDDWNEAWEWVYVGQDTDWNE